MLKKPTPKNLSAEDMVAIVNASRTQSEENRAVKSYDPNFPAFTIPVNKKILVYVPNFTVTMPDGSTDIRMDRAVYHSVRDGRMYGRVRCSRDVILPSIGLDGSCPFCDAEQESLELFFKLREDIAKKKGIDLKSPEAKELLKEDTKKLHSEKAVSEKSARCTFPIVVVDCDDKLLPKAVRADGTSGLTGKVYWYSVSEKQYKEVWLKALDSKTDENGVVPTHPAGLWTILNYHYTDNDSEATIMGSANKLKVSYLGDKFVNAYAQWAVEFDKLAQEWTPEKAIETLADNQIRDMSEMVEACDSIMKQTRDTLAMYKLSGEATPQIATNTNANAVLENFNAVPQIPASPVMQNPTTVQSPTDAVGVAGTGAVPQIPIG